MASRYEEIMKTKPYMPFHMGYLPDTLVARAERELGETEEVKARTIPELRKLITAESKLFCPTDDTYLLQYLRAKKFNVKNAFTVFQNYHQVKAANGDMYDTFDAEKLKKVFYNKGLFSLPYRDDNGCVVFLIKINKWNPDEVTLADFFTGLTLAFLFCLEDPATQVCGFQVLVDAGGLTVKQMRSITPRFILLFSKALRNYLPARFKGIHIYNESVIFQYIWSLLKVFLPEKIKKRFHFHGDNQKQLHKHIPKAILPAEDYGGSNPQDVPSWFNGEVIKFFGRFQELTTYGYKK